MGMTLLYATVIAVVTALICALFGDYTGNLVIAAFIYGGFGYWNGQKEG